MTARDLALPGVVLVGCSAGVAAMATRWPVPWSWIGAVVVVLAGAFVVCALLGLADRRVRRGR